MPFFSLAPTGGEGVNTYPCEDGGGDGSRAANPVDTAIVDNALKELLAST